MIFDYQTAQSVINYLDFLHSENGQIQQKILSEAILNALPKKPGISVLDAGCGPGWMSQILLNTGYQVSACDSSELLIKFAKTHYNRSRSIQSAAKNPSPQTKGILRSDKFTRDGNINFQVADLEQFLPYPQNNFDVVLMNMVGPDIKNLEQAFKNMASILKPDGKLILTIPNPEYSFPAAEWHRSWADVLLMKKPKLIKKSPPQEGAEISREFGKNKFIKSYYHSLNTYLQTAETSGFKLTQNLPLKSKIDSYSFNLNYQMFRYPLILLLEFVKQ
jgi:SAM-dependent methyltransferase